jgi:predicted phage baseplate assembly protein
VPDPIALGGVAPPPAPPRPLLRWEVLDGGTFVPAEVTLDETEGLAHSGVIELGVPRQWRKGRPVGLGTGEPRRWIRLELLFGRFERPPQIAALLLNAVPVSAGRTFRNEVLLPVPNTDGRRMRLSQRPVLPGSLILSIDSGDANAAPAIWREVGDLEDHGPDDKVYVLDPAAGEVSFGDGMHGAEVPVGFRNVVALRYRVGGGAAGAVGAGAIGVVVSSAPFVTAVTNPLPASGGTDGELLSAALARGPEEIRSRGRAVTVADYALLARRAPGALVARAHAVSGLHPSFPGRRIPGVVGVLVVPPDQGDGDPPTPDEGTLRAVATYLTEQVAPAGVEVVAASPLYRAVRAEAEVVIGPAFDTGAVVTAILKRLDGYLHPITGGDDGQGWPFGGAIIYATLIRQILDIPGVQAVPILNLLVDELRGAPCADRPIPPNTLLWPGGHSVVPRAAEGSS